VRSPPRDLEAVDVLVQGALPGLATRPRAQRPSVINLSEVKQPHDFEKEVFGLIYSQFLLELRTKQDCKGSLISGILRLGTRNRPQRLWEQFAGAA
jgi:hypothetical protein